MYTAAAKSGHYEIADAGKGPVGPEGVLTVRGAAGVILPRRIAGAARPIVLRPPPSGRGRRAAPDVCQGPLSE
jgi:hypothetical protein